MGAHSRLADVDWLLSRLTTALKVAGTIGGIHGGRFFEASGILQVMVAILTASAERSSRQERTGLPSVGRPHPALAPAFSGGLRSV